MNNEDQKTCVIINDTFSYVLVVDNQNILFGSAEAADYFEKHYSELGYQVIRAKSESNI